MGLFRRSKRKRKRGVEPERSARDTRAARPGKKRSLVRRLPWEMRLAALVLIYVGIPAAICTAIAFAYYTATIPDPMTLRHREQAPVIRVLAHDGSVLAERGTGNAYLPIDFLPRHLIEAVVATEDHRFFQHRGLDPWGLIRATFANLRAGRFAQGGSTLTQQLAKNLFFSSERTISRKARELVLALWLEMRLSKRDILELYLNRVYFGGGAYGVEAAAQRYFAKSAQKVTLAEAAVLAGVLKAPSRFSPAANPAIARVRARTVLMRMVDAGFLSAQDGQQIARVPVRFAPAVQQKDQGLDYAVDAALERLPPIASSRTREIVIQTTVDARLQSRAQAMVHDLMTRDGRAVDASQAGLVLLDTDGSIRAIVGGRSYAESQFNRASKGKRQPGSAFKPFVYLAALESGLTPDSVVHDLPMLGAGWSPRNDDGRYRGAITLRDALAQSINTVAARLHASVGSGKTAAVARRLGIHSELRDGPSLALGTSEVTLLELTGAYGVLANGGRAIVPYIIRRVRTDEGRTLYERAEPKPQTLVAPAQVGAINDMLSAVLVSGTGRRAALARHPAAGKTGTSQDFRDAWFIGYTARFAAGVWVGNDDGHAMQKVVGGSLPARLWREVMTLAHEGQTPLALPYTAPAQPAARVDAADAAAPARSSIP